MKFVPKGLLGLGAVALAAAPAAFTVASTGAGAQAVEPVVVPFDTVGAHDYVVPDDARCISFEAIGAAGGTGNAATPGLGGRVTGTIQVIPGQTLQVNVGGAGGDASGGTGGAGGFNGGGDGGSTALSDGGGGGGGASDIRQGGTALADRVAVAAGGGGTGSFGTAQTAPDGGNGGDPGVAGGGGDGGDGGGGGTATAGGAGGASLYVSPDADGQAGSFGQGGAGGGGTAPAEPPIDAGAGGGGGGWYGGGGGGGTNQGLPGAGGGGSNHLANFGQTYTGVESGNGADGIVTLSYEPGDTSCVQAPLTIVKQLAGSPLPAPGTQFTVQVQCIDSTIDLGSLGEAGNASSVDLTFTADASGVAQPSAGYTISFIEQNACVVLETDAGGAASTTYACSGSGALQGGEASAESWGVSDAAVVTPGDPCAAGGPQADPIVVNILSSSQEATVTVQNAFAAAAAAVTPRFTG